MFEPLVPSTFRIPNTNWYRADSRFKTEDEFALLGCHRLEEVILFEGPDTVAAFFGRANSKCGVDASRHQTSYFKRIREICDKYDVILVADETITGFGRTGEMFGSQRYDINSRHDDHRQGDYFWCRTTSALYS